MSREELEERYFNWLYNQVSLDKSRARARSRRNLLRQMQETIFVAFVPHDENRIADCRDLRHEYLAEHAEEQGDVQWMRAPCSMLELFVVLSRQLSFQMDDPVKLWFWHLIEMLELERFNDLEYDDHAREIIDKTLERVIWRTYEPNGEGGLFPLRNPREDQRDVELWYQLNAYLMEQF